MQQQQHIILFDGMCNLCDNAVQFVIKRDKKARFYFAPLQGKTGQQFLFRFGFNQEELGTMVYVENNKLFTRSDAALKILLRLGGLYSLLYAFIIVPRPLRNWIYNWIARNRYRWFGKKESCMVPSAALKARFLE